MLNHLDAQGQLLLDETMLDLPKELPPDDTSVADLDKRRLKRTKVDDKSTGGVRFKDTVPVIEVPVEDPALAGVDPKNLTGFETRHSDRIVALPPFAVLRMVIETTKNELTGELSRPEVPAGHLGPVLCGRQFPGQARSRQVRPWPGNCIGSLRNSMGSASTAEPSCATSTAQRNSWSRSMPVHSELDSQV